MSILVTSPASNKGIVIPSCVVVSGITPKEGIVGPDGIEVTGIATEKTIMRHRRIVSTCAKSVETVV